MENEKLWQGVMAQIQLNISPANFATWFRSTRISSIDDGVVVVSVPNSFAKEWLENKYGKTILKILRDTDKKIKETRYEIEKKTLKAKPQKREATTSSTAGQMALEGIDTDKNTNLNPKYIFENFIIGSFNELAHAAGWAVAKNPGKIYNPLFIYGGTGLGKTHLLQAIGNEISKNSAGGECPKRVKYVSSEKFTSGVVSAIKNQQMDKLRESYQKIDVLIIDDIQFLAGKEKTQEEFFHTFNYLYEKNKQIILSSDRPPKAIPSLAERLRSRFEGGMTADISLPDYETRVAILKAKCQEKELGVSADILGYIATNIQKNIRELEGALNRLAVHQKLTNQTINIENAKTLLKNIISPPVKAINPKKILQVVAEFYDLKEAELLSVSRKKEIVKPRQVAMFLLRKELKNSFPFIGRRFGGKDHTTAIHAYEKILRETGDNEELNEEISIIKQRIFTA